MQNTAVRTWLHCSVTNRARSRMPLRSLCVWPRGLPGWVMCLPLTLQNQTPNVKTVGCYSITTRTLLVRWSTWGTSLYSVGCLKLEHVGRSPEMLRTSGASLPDRTKPETLWVRVPLLRISHGWNTWPWNVPSSQDSSCSLNLASILDESLPSSFSKRHSADIPQMKLTPDQNNFPLIILRD